MEIESFLYMTMSIWDKIEWKIYVQKEYGQILITDGWTRFRMAYHLKSGDILTFKYDKKNTLQS